MRASAGLNISENLLAYGVVGERVYIIDISGGFGSEGLDFRAVFSYSGADIGELKLLKFLTQGRLLLSGTKGIALYDLGGNLIKRFPPGAGKNVLTPRDCLLLAEGEKLQQEDLLQTLEAPMQVSQMDLSPDEEQLQKVKSAISSIDSEDIRDLEALAEVRGTREFLQGLPRDFKEKGQSALYRLMQEKNLQDRLRKYRIRLEREKDSFGFEKFPRFSGERKRFKWRLKVEEQLRSLPTRVKCHFSCLSKRRYGLSKTCRGLSLL